MEQLILIETRIGRAYHYYTGSKLEHTFYTSEEGKALFEDYHAKIRQENEEKKQAEIEMMEGVNEEDDLDLLQVRMLSPNRAVPSPQGLPFSV